MFVANVVANSTLTGDKEESATTPIDHNDRSCILNAVVD